MKLQLALLLVFVASCHAHGSSEENCGEFGEWRDWTTSCPWLPISNARRAFAAACGLPEDVGNWEGPPMPEGFVETLPASPCGHCSAKVRCKKRDIPEEMKGKCFPIEMEKQPCEEEGAGNICMMPKVPHMGNCHWRRAFHYLGQCVVTRPDISESVREGLERHLRGSPEWNCKEKDDKCACCCHPYIPNDAGTECMSQPAPTCAPYGAWNDWSECLWFPPTDFVKGIKEHCSVGVGASKSFLDKIKLPVGFSVPPKCGMCSFRVKCRKRPGGGPLSDCFPLQLEKKICGNGEDDCENCGEPCELDAWKGSCEFREHLKELMRPMTTVLQNLGYHKKRGIAEVLKNMPMAKCVSSDTEGKCTCCCHPYEPSADKASCVLKEHCKPPNYYGLSGDD